MKNKFTHEANQQLDNQISEMIRVNHAGELGAKVIYEGQMLALKLKGDYQTLEIVEEMRNQELHHLDYFSKKIIDQKVRPTIMQPLWKIGGFALGFATALIDKKSAMACTTAVEETIDDHYQTQINNLEKIKQNHNKTIEDNGEEIKILDDLLENIKKFQDEEIQHRDIGYSNDARDFKFYKPLDKFIKFTTKSAIAISKKI
jgi:ubiquinone biosynthesis monooxygenase Coq7